MIHTGYEDRFNGVSRVRWDGDGMFLMLYVRKLMLSRMIRSKASRGLTITVSLEGLSSHRIADMMI